MHARECSIACGMTDPFEIFAAVQPGLEAVLCDEILAAGFENPKPVAGGVTFLGQWPDVWRANLVLRGATRILARIGGFRVMHLAQLDKRARKFDWAAVLLPGCAVRVDVTCRKSRIYHAGAAQQRIERALVETFSATIAADATVQIKARIEDDLCTFSVDTSGESLHKRGHKEAVGKAPMRETLAALFLRQAGFDGTQTVVDPMCGSGTFVLEATEISAGLLPGRTRRFAFEDLATFDPAAWASLKRESCATATGAVHFGSDRDDGAIRMAQANALRAGVSEQVTFSQGAISNLMPPDGPPGLVMINPPYGARIGNKKLLFGLYASLGETLKARFSGWRVGLVTSERGLARATGLNLDQAGPPVPHGGLKIALYLADLD